MSHDFLRGRFEKSLGAGSPAKIVVSPGRVNLIGEHTDYNDGLVCPMAIEPCVQIAFRTRVDSRVIVESMQFEGSRVEFDLNEPINPTPDRQHWSNYVRGIARELLRDGLELTGMEAMLSSTIPVGAGLSSSAAVLVGIGMALVDCSKNGRLDSVELSRIALRAEQNFAGVNCGIMDQMIVAAGRRDHAMLLDCRSMETIFIPIRQGEVRIVIINSMQSHALAEEGDQLESPDGRLHRGSHYNMRRLACEIGVDAIRKEHPQVQSLRDVTLEMLDESKSRMNDVIFRRCRHVITEIDRCRRFAQLISESNYHEAGLLMYASHQSLRDDYEVSVESLDKLVEIARSVPGVFGSRLTGAGFGGCTVSLVKSAAVDALIDAIGDHFHTDGIEGKVIVTNATDGARVVDG